MSVGNGGEGSSKFKALISLAVAVFSVSWASILVVLSGAPGTVCAFWRLIFSSALTWIAVLMFKRGTRISLKIIVLTFLAGVCLAAHFAFWMESLFMVPVAISTTVVNAHPLFSAFLGFMILGERPRLLQLIGSVVGIVGIAELAFSTSRVVGEVGLFGVIYALVGALSVAAYFAVGRLLRREMDTLTYTGLVYSWASLILLAYAILNKVDLIGYGLKSWLAFLALAVVPMMLGHTMLNYALRYFSLIAVTTVTLGEPLGAAILAEFILKQKCYAATYFSIALTLFGIALTLIGERGKEA